MRPRGRPTGMARWLWPLCAALCLRGARAVYTLSVVTPVSGAIAGEVFSQQPEISVLEDGVIDTTFEGFAYALLENSPTGFETLVYRNKTGEQFDSMAIYFAFSEGIASFSNLLVNTRGEGFSIRFIGTDSSKAAFAFVDSVDFDVATGLAYKIALSTYPGTAYGGSPFAPQPVVAVQDIGGNTITTHNGGTVTAYIRDDDTYANPTGAALFGTATVAIVNGFAKFDGLSILIAGSPYVIAFLSLIHI